MKKQLLHVVFVFALIATSTLKLSAQGTYNMCSTSGTVTDSTGTLFDSGGPSNIYLVDEDCTLLVAPSCATSIALTFQNFATEQNYDFLYIYDGPTTTSPQLLNTSGGANPGTIIATSGTMLIIWHSDFTIVDSGWAATWTSVIAPSVAPTAAFTINDNNPPLNTEVQFTNTSVGGSTGWYWQFGDGDTAHTENPTHAYSTPGTYTVTFIPFQCSETDTITHTVNVQAAPVITVTPMAGFTASVVCGDSANNIMTIGNTGGGQLVFSTDGSLVGQIKVLAMKYGTDQFIEYQNTLNAIDAHFTNYQLTETGTTDPGVLSGMLVGKNVLLIPEQETNINNQVWPNFAPVIQQFLNNGGSVIFIGSASSLSSNMIVTGIFTGAYASDASGSTVNVINPTHPIALGLPGSNFTAPQSTFTMNFTNSDLVDIVNNTAGETVVGYRYYGSGKAMFLAFDYFQSNPSTTQLIANAVQWGGENALPNWIHITPGSDTVNAAGSVPVTVTFIANSLPAGTYYANISVNSNDPNTPQVSVPCTLTVSGDPIVALSDACFNYGQVIQYVTVKDTLRINNIGCDTLFITSLTNTLGGTSPFTYNANFSYILPGAFVDLVITYQDNNIGTVHDTLYVNNNDSNMWVCLSAQSVPAPVLSPSTSSVNVNVPACAASGSTTIDISNTGVTGAGDLNFTLGSLPAWVSANPTTGTIQQGQTLQIQFTFNSGTFSGGSVPTTLTISSNDPQNPSKNIAINMVVGNNPCITISTVNNTCTGQSSFTTDTTNVPTSYTWDFGDFTGDTAMNPVHYYPYNGNFTATCIACNSAGCDTAILNVNAIITGPKVTSCYPGTAAFCCDIGITNFAIYQGTTFFINKTSPNAIAGFEDFTCTDTATLLSTVPYDVSVRTGQTFSERTRMWIDLNNDAVIDSVVELMYDDVATFVHGGTFTIPDLPSNVFVSPLRLRICSDYQEPGGAGNPTVQPCLDPQYGQCEDYSVFLSPLLTTKTLATETAFSVYPNPFNQTTHISYMLQGQSEVSVEVFNVVGEKVSSFASSEIQSAGRHNYQFTEQSSGIYFVKLTVNGVTASQKIVKM